MMPDADDGIKNDYMGGQEQEAFLIETYTICGYSGSPVFFFIPPLSQRPPTDNAAAVWKQQGVMPLGMRGPWLIGVEWAHLLNHIDVLDKHGAKTGMHVAATTGMACVAPSWKLQELLDESSLADERRSIEDSWLESQPKRPIVSLDAATPSKSERREIDHIRDVI